MKVKEFWRNRLSSGLPRPICLMLNLQKREKAVTFLPTLSGYLDRGLFWLTIFVIRILKDRMILCVIFANCVKPTCNRLIWVPDGGFAVLNNITDVPLHL